MTNPNGLLIKPGQGISLSIVGDVLTFKAVGEDTAGQYTLVEVRVDPDIGTPPHIHHREDEAFYIQEGELEFQLDDQIVIATPGTFLYSPKGHLCIALGTPPPSVPRCWYGVCLRELKDFLPKLVLK